MRPSVYIHFLVQEVSELPTVYVYFFYFYLFICFDCLDTTVYNTVEGKSRRIVL